MYLSLYLDVPASPLLDPSSDLLSRSVTANISQASLVNLSQIMASLEDEVAQAFTFEEYYLKDTIIRMGILTMFFGTCYLTSLHKHSAYCGYGRALHRYRCGRGLYSLVGAAQENAYIRIFTSRTEFLQLEGSQAQASNRYAHGRPPHNVALYRRVLDCDCCGRREDLCVGAEPHGPNFEPCNTHQDMLAFHIWFRRCRQRLLPRCGDGVARPRGVEYSWVYIYRGADGQCELFSTIAALVPHANKVLALSQVIIADSIVWWRAWVLWPRSRVIHWVCVLMILLTSGTHPRVLRVPELADVSSYCSIRRNGHREMV